MGGEAINRSRGSDWCSMQGDDGALTFVELGGDGGSWKKRVRESASVDMGQGGVIGASPGI